MHQLANDQISMKGVKPLCRCDGDTLCRDSVSLVNQARQLCLIREYRYVKLMAMIFYAHRKIELARCKTAGHPTCLKDAIQDMDYVTAGTQALSDVTPRGYPVWETRVITSKPYE